MTDEEAIRRTLSELNYFWDTGDLDRWIELFAEDATKRYWRGSWKGREEILTAARERLPGHPPVFMHFNADTMIDVTGDTASARSVHLAVVPSPHGPSVALMNRVEHDFVRRGGRWLISNQTTVNAPQSWFQPYVYGDPSTGRNGLQRLGQLVRESAAAGIAVTYVASGSQDGIPPKVADTAYQVGQEGIAHAIRHAPGAPIAVFVQSASDAVAVTVTTEHPDGQPPADADTGDDDVFASLRDRLDAVGGSMDTGPADHGGWRLAAQVPVGS